LPPAYSLAGLERYGAEREHNGTSRLSLFCNHVDDNERGGPPEHWAFMMKCLWYLNLLLPWAAWQTPLRSTLFRSLQICGRRSLSEGLRVIIVTPLI